MGMWRIGKGCVQGFGQKAGRKDTLQKPYMQIGG